MPALSPTMEAGTIAAWKVAEGESFKDGDVLAEVETDKAKVDFVATDEGVVAKLLVAAGAGEVKVGEPVIVVVEEAGGVGADTDGARAPAQAERSALPPGWTEHHDRTNNKAYYHHAASKTTTWERPAPGGPPVAAWPVAAAAPAPVAALPKRASYPRGSQRHKSPARQQVRPFSAGRQTLVMPALSPTMEVGTIGSWHKSEGDFVEEGDTIADIETDKATISWDHTGEEGYLSKILVQAGSEVRVGG